MKYEYGEITHNGKTCNIRIKMSKVVVMCGDYEISPYMLKEYIDECKKVYRYKDIGDNTFVVVNGVVYKYSKNKITVAKAIDMMISNDLPDL